MYAYFACLHKDSDGSFRVSFPDVPEAHTFGGTKEEALAHAVEALEAALSFYVEEGKPLPVSRKLKKRSYAISPSLSAELKLAIYQSMRDKGMRKTELARRMGCHLMQIDRLLDLMHASRLDQLEAALACLSRKAQIACVQAPVWVERKSGAAARLTESRA